LSAGSEITIESAFPREPRALPKPWWEATSTAYRVVLGPQDRFFAADDVGQLCSATFKATAQVNRMGMLLAGPQLPPGRVDMPSEPAVRGALQINGRGRVTMLSADYQTTSGYPKIAVLLPHDCDRIAQLLPGQSLRFESVAIDAAQALLRAESERQRDYLQGLSATQSLSEKLASQNLITALVGEL
jgi:allophanate hydrolase